MSDFSEKEEEKEESTPTIQDPPFKTRILKNQILNHRMT